MQIGFSNNHDYCSKSNIKRSDRDMQKVDQLSIAELEFELRWQSSEAAHAECYYAPKASMWCDIFPGPMQEALQGSKKEDLHAFSFAR